MSQVRWTLFLVSVPALSPLAQASVSDRYTLKLDASQSQVRFEIGCSVGQLALMTSAHANLSGDLLLALRPALLPVSSGQIDGGRCSCSPDLVGVVPNAQPGLPPLLEVRLNSISIAPCPQAFLCDANGLFTTQASCVITGGSLEISALGGPFVSVSILDLASGTTPCRGQVRIDGSGVHVVCEIDNTLEVDVPTLNLSLRIGMRGVVRGDMAFPVPTHFLPATPSSSGPPASAGSRGAPGVPVAEDTCCESGQRSSRDAVRVDPGGDGAGARLCFQLAYRDVLVGGALFNASDTIAVDFVP